MEKPDLAHAESDLCLFTPEDGDAFVVDGEPARQDLMAVEA